MSINVGVLRVVSGTVLAVCLLAGAALAQGGGDLRNDITLRREWVERLKGIEETLHKKLSVTDPYALIYFNDIKTGKINYQTETAEISFIILLRAESEWLASVDSTLLDAKVAMDSLNATNRKIDWGLNEWPQRGVSKTNPFEHFYRWHHDFSIEFEIIDKQDKVIGKQIVNLKPNFRIEHYRNNDNIFTIIFSNINYQPLQPITVVIDVKVDDVSEHLTIRHVGKPPTTSRLKITSMSMEKYREGLFENFTDPRDKQTYRTVKIGKNVWMADNLNYKTERSGCYDGADSNCVKYGRLYHWDDAITACPAGWRLATQNDWWTLSNINSGSLLSMTGWGENNHGGIDEFGFSALPGGWFRGRFGDFNGIGWTAYWWTAGRMVYQSLTVSRMDQRHTNDNNGFSVRCVQN